MHSCIQSSNNARVRRECMTPPALCVLPAQTPLAAAAINKSLIKVLLPMHTQAKHACWTELDWRPSFHLERWGCCFANTQLSLSNSAIQSSTTACISLYITVIFIAICCLMRLTYHCIRRVIFSRFYPAASVVDCEFAISFVSIHPMNLPPLSPSVRNSWVSIPLSDSLATAWYHVVGDQRVNQFLRTHGLVMLFERRWIVSPNCQNYCFCHFL